MSIIWRIIKRIFSALWKAVHTEDVWREFSISSDKYPEPTLQMYSYMRERGIRCYLHNLTSPSGRGVSTGMVSLRVHKDDVNRARSLISGMRR